MVYKTLNEFEEEIHPWSPFIPKDAQKLIIGTFPTAKANRGSLDFFYPNPNNNFWRILFWIAKKKLCEDNFFDQVQLRKEVLEHLKLGICDIGKRILRQKGSSLDSNIFPIEYTNIFDILEANPSLEKLIITSSSKGNSVLSWFHHYCTLNKYNFKIPPNNLPKKTMLHFQGREIIIEIISSTSGLSPIKGDRLLAMYYNAILGC